MKLGCWKIKECSNCYTTIISLAKVTNCMICKNNRNRKAMNIVEYLF